MSIVLFSNNCPKCKTLKFLLDNKNISYIENNSIEEMLALGFTKAPILRVDNVDMDADSAQKWIMEYDKEKTDEE